MTKILIVDDEESIRDLAQTILEDRGYEVITTANGSKAIEAFQLEQPDLVLLDICMPGMNGFEVCTVLKSQNFSKEVPVVMFTVSSGEDDRKLAKEGGCNGYFLKPFSSDDLVREVEKYTGKK